MLRTLIGSFCFLAASVALTRAETPTPNPHSQERNVHSFSGKIVEGKNGAGEVKVQFDKQARPPVGMIMHAYHRTLFRMEMAGHLEIVRYENQFAICKERSGEKCKVAKGDLIDGAYEIMSQPEPKEAVAQASTPKPTVPAPTATKSAPKIMAKTASDTSVKQTLPPRSEAAKSKGLLAPPRMGTPLAETEANTPDAPRESLFTPPWFQGKPSAKANASPAPKSIPETVQKPVEKKRVRLSISDDGSEQPVKSASAQRQETPQVVTQKAKSAIAAQAETEFPLPVVDQGVLESYR